MLKNDEIRQAVHDLYSQAANNECCGSTCCSGSKPELAEHMGYSPDELKAVPTGANLGFGCGNPQAIAALKPGEMVLDLGSGAGFDCFLASRSARALEMADLAANTSCKWEIIGNSIRTGPKAEARRIARNCVANNSGRARQ